METEANNFGEDHGDGLAEHNRFGFDTTNAPADDSQAVDHCGVTVGTDDGIGEEPPVFLHDDSGQILEVDLMDNARAGGNYQEILEGSRAPLEKLEAFVVACELDLLIFFEGVGDSRHIGLDGVVDNQIDRAERVDALRIPAESLHGIPHGSQINDCRYSSEILEDDSGRFEGDFDLLDSVGFPVQDILHIRLPDGKLITVSDC